MIVYTPLAVLSPIEARTLERADILAMTPRLEIPGGDVDRAVWVTS